MALNFHRFFKKLQIVKIFVLTFVFFSIFGYLYFSQADSSGFQPTWKLLSHDQKEYFISGYVYGWQDAAKVTDIAIQFVEENPEKAVEGLQKIKQLYKIRGLKTDELVKEIDKFYSDPVNSRAPLSMAVTAAK